ncbi:MAG TPA: Hsp20/alpha crystallin family protein [Alphaproteobacteria bacterium]
MATRLPSLWGRSWLTGEGRDEPFAAIHRDIDRMLDDFTRGWRLPAVAGRAPMLAPAVDVSETEDAIEVSAELPGIAEKDIEVEVAGNTLTIKGEKKEEKEEKKKDYHLVERTFGSFQRTLPMPFDIDPDRIKANFADGVLTVSVPKPAAAKEKVKKIKLTRG